MAKDKILEAVSAARESNIRQICRNLMTARGLGTEHYEEHQFETLVGQMTMALEPFNVDPFP